MSRQRAKRGRHGAAPSNVIELDPGLGAFLASDEGRRLTAGERVTLVRWERVMRRLPEWRSSETAARAPDRWETALLLMRSYVEDTTATKYANHIADRLREEAKLVLLHTMIARRMRTKRGREQAFKKAREAMKRLGSCRHVLRGCLDDLEAEPLNDVEAAHEAEGGAQ